MFLKKLRYYTANWCYKSTYWSYYKNSRGSSGERNHGRSRIQGKYMSDISKIRKNIRIVNTLHSSIADFLCLSIYSRQCHLALVLVHSNFEVSLKVDNWKRKTVINPEKNCWCLERKKVKTNFWTTQRKVFQIFFI